MLFDTYSQWLSRQFRSWSIAETWMNSAFLLTKTRTLLLKVKLNPSNKTLCVIWRIPPHPSADHIFIQTNTLKCGCRNFRFGQESSTDPYKPTKEFFFIFISWISVFPRTISCLDFIAMCIGKHRLEQNVTTGKRLAKVTDTSLYKLLIHTIYCIFSTFDKKW